MKLAEQTADKIKLAIAGKGWPLGSVIGSEAELLAEYGVSRAVLREAVRLLEHDHVAHMRRGPGGGLVVAEPDAGAVISAATLYLGYREVRPGQLFAARAAIELAAVRSAAESLDEQGIDVLRHILAGEVSSDQRIDVDAHDFHLGIARLSGNPAVELLTNVLIELSAAAFVGRPALFGQSAGRSGRTVVQPDPHAVHQQVAEAVIGGDVGLAQHRMARHLQAVAEVVSPSGTASAHELPADRRPRRRPR
jgi:DNA-binding FadR family transcriptional regulator